MRKWKLLFAVLACLTFDAAAQADEEKIEIDKLPAKVVAAVKEKFKDAELVSASKEKEDDKTLFEVQIKVKGQTIEVTLTEDGKITEIEKEITAKDLPKAVTEAIDAKYPKAKFKKVEEVTKGEKVAYEVLIDTADKKTLEIKCDADGKVLEMEDKTGKDDENDKKEEKKKDK